MPESRKLDPQVEEELARLLSAAVKSDLAKGRGKKQPPLKTEPVSVAMPRPLPAKERKLSKPPAAPSAKKSPAMPQQQPADPPARPKEAPAGRRSFFKTPGPSARQSPDIPGQPPLADAGGSQETPKDQEQPASNSASQQSDRQRASSFFNRAQNIVESRGLQNVGDRQFAEDYDSFKKGLIVKTPLGAIKQGVALGASLRRGLASGAFNSFLLALLLAVCKDLWDMLDLTGITGTMANLFITVAILTVVSFQGTWFKRWLIKKYLGKYILALMAEFIPGVAIFPTYTIMVLIIKFQNDKNQARTKAAIAELESEMKKLKV